MRELVAQWRKLGLEVFFDEDDIRGGTPIVTGVQEGLEQSRFVVLVLSEQSLNSRWVALEIGMTIFSDPAALQNKLIPILLEPIEEGLLPPAIRRLRRVDLTTDTVSVKRNYHGLLQQLGVNKTPLPSPPKRTRKPDGTPLMKPFSLAGNGKALAIGAHWDDILLGCFGTLLRLKRVFNYDVTIHVLCNKYQPKYYGVPQPADFLHRVNDLMKKTAEKYDMKYFTVAPGRPNTEIADRSFHDNARFLHEHIREVAHEHEDHNLIFAPLGTMGMKIIHSPDNWYSRISGRLTKPSSSMKSNAISK